MDVGALFREHHQELFRYLVRLTGDETTARDAVQHAFMRMLEKPPADVAPRAWLYRVATNVAMDWTRGERRRARIRAEMAHQIPTPSYEPAPDWQLDRKRNADRVRSALNELSERDRTLLLLRHEGLTHREMAEAVGTTTGSVGTLIARALDKLGRLLNEDEFA